MKRISLLFAVLALSVTGTVVAGVADKARAVLENGGGDPIVVAALVDLAVESPEAAVDVVVTDALEGPRYMYPLMAKLLASMNGEAKPFLEISARAQANLQSPALKKLVADATRAALHVEFEGEADPGSANRIGEDLVDPIGEDPLDPGSPS